MASNQYWDQGLPNELIPSYSYDGNLLYWDQGLPIPALQSTDIFIVGNAIVGAPVVPSGGVVASSSLPIAGTTITGGHTVPAGGVVALASLSVVGVSITGGAQVPTGGVVSVVNVTPAPPVGYLGSGYGDSAMPIPRPNEYDGYLQDEYRIVARIMSGVVDAWGLNGIPPCIASDPDAVFGDFHLRQELRRNFFYRGTIVTPTTLLGDNVVISFTVPNGYFGLLLGVYNVYTGTGFVQGAGDIVWRIMIGGRWLRNFGNQLFSQGSTSNPFPLMASDTLMPGEMVQFVVNVPNTSGSIQVGASNILCGLQGWFYPMPTRRMIASDPGLEYRGRGM